MILNVNYYNDLINQYSVRYDCDRTVSLSLSMILDNYEIENVYFHFPKYYDLQKIINLLYENLSNRIFKKYADIKGFSVGDKLKENAGKKKNLYEIIKIENSGYTIKKLNDNGNLTIPNLSFDKLKRKYSFAPQHFPEKLVLIAGQTMYNNLKNKNCIPPVYLPNTREGEQTKWKSIEALEDSIAYITPKYEVCYDKILKNNIEVDTIVVCDADLSSISQILQDKPKYNFNLIVLSNENDVQRLNNLTLWNWQQEEIELIEKKCSKNISIDEIKDDEIKTRILHFEECMQYVSSLEIPVKLKSYGYFLRSALNALQDEQFDYLLMRLKRNKELEQNEGGYEDFAEYNPKEALKNLILYLKEHNSKYSKLFRIMSKITKNTLVVADREDYDLLESIWDSKCQVVTNAELKRLLKNREMNWKTIVFYSFNGGKDFRFIHDLPNNVSLLVYQQEKELYCKQLQIHIEQLEIELTSEDREEICGIKYEPVVKREIKVNPTLAQIIERLEQRSNTAYDGYKNESDSLLDDLEEEINYKVTMSNGERWTIPSNETVFDSKGDLIKSYKLKIGNTIRLYPKEKLAENLFQIAIELEPDEFGKIDEHANAWQNALRDIEQRITDRERLYRNLKNNGLKVLSSTLATYFRGIRKFPMYNSDLRAILKVAGKELLYEQIKKSKRLYNSTMIALGRGIKQELQQFLKYETVGEILQKKKFTKETLRKFIEEFMSLLTITKIEEVGDEQ